MTGPCHPRLPSLFTSAGLHTYGRLRRFRWCLKCAFLLAFLSALFAASRLACQRHATPRLLVVLPSLSLAQSTTPTRTSRIQSAEHELPRICVPPSTMTLWDTPLLESSNPNLGKYLSHLWTYDLHTSGTPDDTFDA